MPGTVDTVGKNPAESLGFAGCEAQRFHKTTNPAVMSHGVVRHGWCEQRDLKTS